MKMKIYIVFSLFIVVLISFGSQYCYGNQGGEEYIIKEVALIPWGEEDSLLGFIPSSSGTNELSGEDWFEPGEAVISWDIGLDGKIYVADGVKKRVSVYDSNGHYLRSIGIWNQKSDKITIKTTSGKEKTVYSNHPLKYDTLQHLSIPFSYKVYFDSPAGVAVDGNANVYIIPSLSAKYLMKFPPDGKLLEIIDQFGEYRPEDMKMGIGQVFSDAYGNVFVDVSLKRTYIFVKFNENGKIISITEKKIQPQDAEGNLYDLLSSNKKWNERKSQISISVKHPKTIKEDTLTVHFGHPSSASFWRADGDGNLYFNVGWSVHKYDQQGNLLAIIQGKHDTKRTLTHPMAGMGKISKLMANGDIYVAYMCDQGFVIVKQELQQETKGQILKPAVKPEK